MKIIVLFCFLLIVFGIGSPIVSRADNEKSSDFKTDNVLNVDDSPQLQEMREYMKNQQQKQQKIALLSLDLDEVKLELELREKKAALGHYLQTGDYPLMAAQKTINGQDSKFKSVGINETDPDVRSIFVTNSYKEAVLDADGSEVTVKEGDNIGGVKVKSIDPNVVTLVRENNEEFKIAIKE